MNRDQGPSRSRWKDDLVKGYYIKEDRDNLKKEVSEARMHKKDKEAMIIELVSRFQEATSNAERVLETLNR